MDRRKFLLSAGGIALLGAGLALPAGRKFFLPPRGGWPQLLRLDIVYWDWPEPGVVARQIAYQNFYLRDGFVSIQNDEYIGGPDLVAVGPDGRTHYANIASGPDPRLADLFAYANGGRK